MKDRQRRLLAVACVVWSDAQAGRMMVGSHLNLFIQFYISLVPSKFPPLAIDSLMLTTRIQIYDLCRSRAATCVSLLSSPSLPTLQLGREWWYRHPSYCPWLYHLQWWPGLLQCDVRFCYGKNCTIMSDNGWSVWMILPHLFPFYMKQLTLVW